MQHCFQLLPFFSDSSRKASTKHPENSQQKSSRKASTGGSCRRGPSGTVVQISTGWGRVVLLASALRRLAFGPLWETAEGIGIQGEQWKWWSACQLAKANQKNIDLCPEPLRFVRCWDVFGSASCPDLHATVAGADWWRVLGFSIADSEAMEAAAEAVGCSAGGISKSQGCSTQDLWKNRLGFSCRRCLPTQQAGEPWPMSRVVKICWYFVICMISVYSVQPFWGIPFF